MTHVEYFTNDNFRVLAYLYDVRNEQNKANITQQEVADILGVSRVTINKIIGELKVLGYIKQDGNHVGRYIVTENAIKVTRAFRAADKKEKNDDKTIKRED